MRLNRGTSLVCSALILLAQAGPQIGVAQARSHRRGFGRQVAFRGHSRSDGLLSHALERAFVCRVRLHNKRIRQGKASDLAGVFLAAGRMLERSHNQERAALAAVLWPRSLAARSAAGSQRPFTPKLEQALVLALRLHNHQLRKSTGVPYMCHLLNVGGQVMRAGGSEKAVIAALLHDAVEDQGGRKTLALIKRRFGDGVAKIVQEVSEPPDLPWRLRKEQKIHKIAKKKVSSAAILIKLADCNHNSSAVIRDWRRQGDRVWQAFSTGQSGTTWYYSAMLAAFRQAGMSGPLLEQLSHNVRVLTTE